MGNDGERDGRADPVESNRLAGSLASSRGSVLPRTQPCRRGDALRRTVRLPTDRGVQAAQGPPNPPGPGVAMAGPVGALVGGTVGALAGALGGAAVGATLNPQDRVPTTADAGVVTVPAPVTWVRPTD